MTIVLVSAVKRYPPRCVTNDSINRTHRGPDLLIKPERGVRNKTKKGQNVESRTPLPVRRVLRSALHHSTVTSFSSLLIYSSSSSSERLDKQIIPSLIEWAVATIVFWLLSEWLDLCSQLKHVLVFLFGAFGESPIPKCKKQHVWTDNNMWCISEKARSHIIFALGLDVKTIKNFYFIIIPTNNAPNTRPNCKGSYLQNISITIR